MGRVDLVLFTPYSEGQIIWVLWGTSLYPCREEVSCRVVVGHQVCSVGVSGPPVQVQTSNLNHVMMTFPLVGTSGPMRNGLHREERSESTLVLVRTYREDGGRPGVRS